MRSLDQALIRALEHPAVGPPVTLPDASGPIPLRDALAEASGRPLAEDDQNTAFSEHDETTSTDASTAARKEPFRAMLQVESVIWPGCLTEMHSLAEIELDQLAAGLLDGETGRREIVGIAGSSPGVGCTTLVLGVARRLARHGVKLVVVDANTAHPALVSELGLLPEVGWDAVVAGRLPLAEVLIESIEDKITLLPLCHPAAMFGATGAEGAALTAKLTMETLRQHYDVVLVDLGMPGAGDDTALALVADWLDAVALVHDVRGDVPEALARARAHIEAFGVPIAGAAENFVSFKEASAWRDTA